MAEISRRSSKTSSDNAVPHTFTISGRWHAGYSLLGRWIERRSASRWHAGGLLIIALAAGATTLLLATAAAWMLGASAVLAALMFLWILFLAAGLAGFQPPIHVEVARVGESAKATALAQGTRRRIIDTDAIENIGRLDPVTYHRLFRRDGVTDCWVNDPTRTMLRIILNPTDEESHSLILGLPPNDHAGFLNALNRQHESHPAQAD